MKVEDFTLDDLMEETYKGRLSHGFIADWDGKVLDTFGRRVSLDEVTSMADTFEPFLRDLPNSPEGYTGWYSQRA